LKAAVYVLRFASPIFLCPFPLAQA
jgi:hypothetical protein